jgi:diguanylate cyclase (GGDEF)-like protein
MHSRRRPMFILASNEPALLARIEPALAAKARVKVVLSADAALAAMSGEEPPALALLDANLPGMPLGQLLAAARADAGRRYPIVLFSDTVSEETKDRIAEGVIDDLVPPDIALDFLRLRVAMALRAREHADELEILGAEVVQNAQFDRLTGAYNRDAMLAQLFRETDRVQRMNTSLCLILFDIDDFGHWNMRLGNQACDQLLAQAVKRVNRLLRSYDILARVGKDEFLAALPGCSAVNAVLLTERIRTEVFGAPFRVEGRAVRLSACFGVAPSKGRSPVVVLREAEEALRVAKENGPESIQCASDCPQAAEAPIGFLSPGAEEEPLPW